MGYRTRLRRPAKLDSDTIPYNNAREFTPPNKGEPFNFTGVTMQVYPLRADLGTLQAFVDNYLNSIFPNYDAGYFRAFIPYVYLMMINYGRMSLNASNVGWVSQREFLFNIPLQWYVRQEGQWVFKDWAQIAPFIFVDNEMSITLGREVYGWPKKLVSLDTSDPNLWLGKPIGPNHLFTLSTTVVPTLYQGELPVDRIFLEVRANTLDSLFMMPPDWQGPYMPWMVSNHLASFGAGMGGDALELMRNARFYAQRPELAASSFARMGHGLMRMMNPVDPDVYFNCINLKQFRQASRPTVAAYQAITNSQMRIKRLTRAGLIGGEHQALADPSGGIRIDLHSFDSLPIQKTLGLKIVRESGSDHHAVLRPVFPYWVEVDMTYGKATTVADRCIPVGTMPTAANGMKSREIRTSDGMVAQTLIGPLEYPNTTLRVLPLLATPEKLKKFCKEYLNDTLAQIQGGMEVTFEPWGHYVYLVALNNEDIVSSENRESRLHDMEVTFYVPVLMYVKQPGEKAPKLNTVALLPVTSFSSDATAAATASEVQGIPTTHAQMINPPSSWMEDSGPSDTTPVELLTLQTLVFPALGQGQPAQVREVLQIVTGRPFKPNDDARTQAARERWSAEINMEFAPRLQYQKRTSQKQDGTKQDGTKQDKSKQDKSKQDKSKQDKSKQDKSKQDESKEMPELKTAQALALEVLARRFPINVIALKQIRGAEHPDHAVYQSLLEFEYTLDSVVDLREIEGNFFVRINDFASERIVERLGLVPALFNPEGPDLVYSFEPVHPFWVKVSMRCSLGRPLLRRSGSPTWTPVSLGSRKGYFEPDPAEKDTPQSVPLEGLFETLKEAEKKRHLTATVQSWVNEHGLKPGEKLPIPGAENVLPHPTATSQSQVNEHGLKPEEKRAIPGAESVLPQPIPLQWLVESILSLDWLNRSPQRWIFTPVGDSSKPRHPPFWLPEHLKSAEGNPNGIPLIKVPHKPSSQMPRPPVDLEPSPT